MHFRLNIINELEQSLHHCLLVAVNIFGQLRELLLSLFVHLLGKVVLGACGPLLLVLELGFSLPPVVLNLSSGFFLRLLQPLGFSWGMRGETGVGEFERSL